MYSSLRYMEAAMPTSLENQSQQAAINPSGAYLTLALPVLLGITISGFFKYRSRWKRRQIKILEQIWQQDVDIRH